MKQRTKIILGMILLMLIVSPLVMAVECVGQGCSTNMNLSVYPNVTTNITITQRTLVGQAIYEVLDSSGAGLGIFFQIIGRALPFILFVLVIIAIIVAIIYTILKSTKLWQEATN